MSEAAMGQDKDGDASKSTPFVQTHLDFRGLPLEPSSLLSGHEAKDIIPAVTNNVVLPILLLHLRVVVLREGSDAENKGPVEGVDFVEASVKEGGGGTGLGEHGREVEGRSKALVEELSHWPANAREHGKPTVLNLSLPHEGQGCLVTATETEGVETSITRETSIEVLRFGEEGKG